MDIPYNDDECAVDDYEDESDNDIGLDSDDLEEEENLLSQVIRTNHIKEKKIEFELE